MNQRSDQGSDEPVDEQADEGMPDPPATGDDHVDEALHALAQAVREPLETQVLAFERAHRSLQDRLADVES